MLPPRSISLLSYSNTFLAGLPVRILAQLQSACNAIMPQPTLPTASQRLRVSLRTPSKYHAMAHCDLASLTLQGH